MSESLKISGKRIPLPGASTQKWTFEVRPGGWVIAQSDRGVRKKIMLQENKGRVSASIQGYLWAGERSIDSSNQKGSGGADSDLTAQFPGKVRKILVQEGAEVKPGDSLVLVEAMKMEFAIRAPFAGKVRRICVQEGQQLSPGNRFLELEGKPEE